ncbi:MAG: beta-ketoacyl-[acyl-carrier-protein] synthase family protein [Deltaproteobacteria bacterium]|nr:beta-ketoacyl-[acyl-carrier-protein] synthase family protein [Deltaproteobacteria bacterium]
MQKKRVVVTGIGPVTPLGIGKEPYWRSLMERKTGIDLVEFPNFDMEQFKTRIGAQIKDFSLDDYLPFHKGDRHMGRASQFALVGAKIALEDAKLELLPRKGVEGRYELNNLDSCKIGAILGVAVENMEIMEGSYDSLLKYGSPRRLSPFALPNVYTSSVATNATERFGIHGTTFVVSSACASASHAIATSYNKIQDGPEEMMLTGGSDACITPLTFGGFIALRAMSTRNDEPLKACRPFDMHRDGFVMGEGAGIILLEEMNHALKREAPIYAELVGCGMTADAFHIAEPDPTAISLSKAISQALAMGGVEPKDIDYINPHGTSTPLNDSTETKAIKRVFGDYAYQIPISATKSMVGHLLGAAGGVEAIVITLTMKHGMIHPTINYEFPDPECDLDYVPDGPREKTVRTALSISAGFGGVNCVLLFKAFEP